MINIICSDLYSDISILAARLVSLSLPFYIQFIIHNRTEKSASARYTGPTRFPPTCASGSRQTGPGRGLWTPGRQWACPTPSTLMGVGWGEVKPATENRSRRSGRQRTCRRPDKQRENQARHRSVIKTSVELRRRNSGVSPPPSLERHSNVLGFHQDSGDLASQRRWKEKGASNCPPGCTDRN